MVMGDKVVFVVHLAVVKASTLSSLRVRGSTVSVDSWRGGVGGKEGKALC